MEGKEVKEWKEVIVRGDKELALYELETLFAMAVRQRELLEKYIKERLQPDKHFYSEGDDPGQKPSLTKEGAELICLPHGLKSHYHWLSGLENPPLDDSPYQVTMKCELENKGKFEGEGIGSASSMVTKKDGTRVQRQRDPGLRHNATIKMACKSAYIAATLNSTAASEFFTQDLEDDQTGEATKSDKIQHWCKEHNTAFFMKGKMKSYAHPINGTEPVEWCHEHTKDKKDIAPMLESQEVISKSPKEEVLPEDTSQTTAIAEPMTSEAEPQAKNGVPRTTDQLLTWIATNMNWKSAKPARSWAVNKCKIPEEKMDSDPEWCYKEICQLQDWS